MKVEIGQAWAIARRIANPVSTIPLKICATVLAHRQWQGEDEATKAADSKPKLVVVVAKLGETFVFERPGSHMKNH